MKPNYSEKYAKYKYLYLELKKQNQSIDQSINQSGGGAWGEFSFDNDNVHDELVDFRDEAGKLFSEKKINSLLQNMFDKYDERVRKNDPGIKKISFSEYILSPVCAGVVVYLLISDVNIAIKFLIKSLVQLYRDYLKVYVTKEASGWRSYQARLDALKIEISILNYAINNGSLEKIRNIISPSINTADILSGNIFIGHDNKLIFKYIGEHQRDFFDYVFIKPDPLKPYLNPNILYDKTIMLGKDPKYKHMSTYYITKTDTDGNKTWVKYDTFETLAYQYLPTDFLSDIYGEQFEKLSKLKHKETKITLS